MNRDRDRISLTSIDNRLAVLPILSFLVLLAAVAGLLYWFAYARLNPRLSKCVPGGGDIFMCEYRVHSLCVESERLGVWFCGVSRAHGLGYRNSPVFHPIYFVQKTNPDFFVVFAYLCLEFLGFSLLRCGWNGVKRSSPPPHPQR